MYKILCKDGSAKRGRLETVHGTIETPVFMNVATVGAMKGAVSTEDLQNLKTQVVLSNTYHLHVRPGDEIVKKMGGIHKFMVWDKYSTDNIADNEMMIAVDDVVKKDYDSAVVRIKKALARLKSTGHVEKYAEYLNILGLVYEIENDESKAFECYLESLATAEIIRSRDLKAMVYSNIGSSYSKMGRDKEAQRYFNDARDEYDSSSEKSEECHKSWVMFDYINHAINDRYVALS